MMISYLLLVFAMRWRLIDYQDLRFTSLSIPTQPTPSPYSILSCYLVSYPIVLHWIAFCRNVLSYLIISNYGGHRTNRPVLALSITNPHSCLLLISNSPFFSRLSHPNLQGLGDSSHWCRSSVSLPHGTYVRQAKRRKCSNEKIEPFILFSSHPYRYDNKVLRRTRAFDYDLSLFH